MQLSEGVEWALHCCHALSLAGGTAIPVGRLAEFHGIPAAYLQKHLQALVRAGVLESVPGRRGGFRLARRPEDIPLLDVVEAIEGRDPPFRCTEIRQRGPFPAPKALCRRPCQIMQAMRQAEDAWRAVLRTQTLADIAAQVERDYVQALGDARRAEAIARVQDWLRPTPP